MVRRLPAASGPAGLVYKHYGREIVASAMGLPSDSPEVEAVYLAVYKNFMESIDAIDNGECAPLLPCCCRAAVLLLVGAGAVLRPCCGWQPGCAAAACQWSVPKSGMGCPAGACRQLPCALRRPLPLAPHPHPHTGVNQWDSDAPPKYVNNTHLSARVGRLNPDWNQDSSGGWHAELNPLFPYTLVHAMAINPGMLAITAPQTSTACTSCNPSPPPLRPPHPPTPDRRHQNRPHIPPPNAATCSALPAKHACRGGHDAAVQGGHGADGQRVHRGGTVLCQGAGAGSAASQNM